jgi:hypothetical protein
MRYNAVIIFERVVIAVDDKEGVVKGLSQDVEQAISMRRIPYSLCS